LPPGAVKGAPRDDDLGGNSSSIASDDTDYEEESSLSSLEDPEEQAQRLVIELINGPPPETRPGVLVQGQHDHEREPLRPEYAFAHRKELEDLYERQYWREDWQIKEPMAPRFDIGDASVLGRC
jgi:hypothetical protein